MSLYFQSAARRFVDHLIGDEIDQADHIPILQGRDPFRVADPCPFNAGGHDPITSCGETVCCHCAKVFWR